MKHGVGHNIHTKEKTICRKQEKFFLSTITIIHMLTCHKGKPGTFAQCDSFFNGQDRQYFCDTRAHNISAKF